MSSRSPKSSKSAQPKPQLSALAVAAVVATQPATPAQPTSEQYEQELNLALAAQGGAKANTLWDELNDLHDSTIEKIREVGEEIADQVLVFGRDPQRVSEIEPWRKTRLKKLLDQFGLDTQQHFSDLDTIQEVHKGRSGGIVTSTDFMQVVSLQGDYAERQELHGMLTEPQVSEMLEITGAVELKPVTAATPAANDSNTDAAQA